MSQFLKNYLSAKLFKVLFFCLFVFILITASFALPFFKEVNAQQNVQVSIPSNISPIQEGLVSATPRFPKNSADKRVEEKPARQDPKFAETAKEIIEKKNNIDKNKLKIANASDAQFIYSGKKAHSIKLIDDRGVIYGITLDDAGRELDDKILAAEDLGIKKAKYGKFEPAFFEKLTNEPIEKPVKAIIVLKIPYFDPLSRPAGQLPDNGSNISQNEIDKLNKDEKELLDSKSKPVLEAVIKKFNDKGYDISGITDGLVSIELPIKVLKEIQEWDEVEGINDGTTKYKPALASARPASGITAINNRNINGTGVKVAQIEVGEGNGIGVRLPTTNPYLPMTNIIQDITYACPSAGHHASMVAGILKSTNLANTGLATGVTLWASGSCSGDKSQVYNRQFEAASGQQASAINMSMQCFPEGPDCPRYPNSSTGQFDGMAFYSTHPSLIISAGNTGWNSPYGDGTYNIYDIATAYNVITVGSYDDKNNEDPFDDTISDDFSSWKNPSSQHGDREKPELVAPGTNIVSTGVSSILQSGSGTSFAAPIVTGGSALLMQRAAILKNEPEALKALLLVTARNDVARDGQIPSGDSKDGYGGVDFDWADKLLQGITGGSVVFGDYRCESTPTPYNINMNITNTQPQRAFFVWRVNWYDPSYSSQPNMDFDITIKDPNGNVVGSSASYDNNIEGVYFYPTVTGNYTMEVNRYRCNTPYTYTRYAAGWNQVPTYIVEYFNNKTLSGTPVLRRFEEFINYDWGYGSPGSGVNSDNFSVRWTKTEHFNAGTYEFTATSDDGVRLYIDNVKIIDKWIDQGATTYKAIRNLTDGNHTIKYEYYDNTNGAVAKLSYEKVTPIISGGIYRLVNQCSGKVMDVSGGSTADLANIQQWGWANVAQQKWKIDSLTGGFYKLTAQHSNKVAEVYGNSVLDGGNVSQYTWNGGNNQQWGILNVGAGYSKFIVRHSGKVLDVYNASLNDGANINQWGDNGSCAQRWRLDKL